jgi:PAS domain S-box-containing protein
VGYSPAALVGTSLMDYLAPDDADPMRALLQNGDSTASGAAPLEFCLRRSDGTPVWLEAVGTNLLTDPTIRGIVLNARDVSERKRADTALRESEERYRDLFDNASDLACMVDPAGVLLYANYAWQQGTGYGAEEICSFPTFFTPTAGSITPTSSSGCSPASAWTTSNWCSSPNPARRSRSRGT